MMNHDILNEQIAYYRARAQEYDQSTGETEEREGTFAHARDLLQQIGPFEQVLELASGTGTWTRVLLPMGRDITAIDASPEMLAIAQQKLGNTHVSYQQADLFQWRPEQDYDLVFFANWLSHVPPQDFGAFLTRVFHAVRPGGHLAIIDQYAPTLEDQQIMKEGEGGNIYAQRSLLDGKVFTIIKVFYNTRTLQETLASLGFECVVHQLNDIFFFLSARRL